jgi:hypothetical protein
MPLPILPNNDGWNDVEYDLGTDTADSARVGALLNEACHVFRYHAEGTWQTHDKDPYAGRLADEIRARPGLVGRLLATNDRVVKMLTHRALELMKERESPQLLSQEPDVSTVVVPTLNPSSVDVLLDGLCITLGFCLLPEARLKLRHDPALDVATFTNAVFLAEGLEPSRADRQLYRRVRDMIQDAFRRAEDESQGSG